MATNKSKRKIVPLIHEELQTLAVRLHQTRASIRLLQKSEGEIKNDITQITQDWEVEEEFGTTFRIPVVGTDLNTDISMVPGQRSSLDREKLEELGVKKSLLKKATKISKFIQIEIDV